MSVTFRFNEILYPRKDKNNYAVGTVINIPFTENGQSFNELSFSASGVLEYRDNRGETLISYTRYNSNAFNWEYDATLSNVSMPNVVVEGYLYNGEFYANYSVEEGYTNKIVGAVNKIYSDKLGTGVYLFDGVYNNVFDLNADNLKSMYYSLSIGNSIYVLAQNGYDLSIEQNVKNVLINSDTQKYYIRNPYRSTYCLQYFKEEQASEFTLLLVSYVWYSHWSNQVYREIIFEDFSLIDDEQYSDAISWLSNNGRIINDFLVTNRDSLDLVAKTIKEQVGDDASVGYYYPDKENVDNTFIKKIKQLNNTYTHTNNNPASENNVLEGKSYWRDGEERIGTMTDYHNWGTHSITYKDQYVYVPKGYHSGQYGVQISRGDKTNLIPSNIKNNVTILGVTGSPTVIETDAVKNPDFDTQRYNTVTPDTLLDGYGAFMSGEVVYGGIRDYVFPTYENNNAIYPTLPAAIATKTDKDAFDNDIIVTHANLDDNYARISQNTKITIPFSTFSNEAYSDLKIANYDGTDKVLNDVKQYYPASLSIFGVSGEAYSAQNIESVNENQIWVEGSVIFDIPKNGYYNTYGGIEASYESFVNAYNRLNDDKISSENIKSGKSIFGIPGNSDVINTNQRYLTTGKAPIISSAILTGYSGFVNGQEVVGNYGEVLVSTKELGEYNLDYHYGGRIVVSVDYDGVSHTSHSEDVFKAESGKYVYVRFNVTSLPVGPSSIEIQLKHLRFYRNGVFVGGQSFPAHPQTGEFTSFSYLLNSSADVYAEYGEFQSPDDPTTFATIDVHFNDKSIVDEKTITENGEYSATDDGVIGYSKVTVNVAGGGSYPATNVTADDVRFGKTFYTSDGTSLTSSTGTMSNANVQVQAILTNDSGYFDNSGTLFEVTYGADATSSNDGWVSSDLYVDTGPITTYIKESSLQSSQTISTKAGTVNINEGYVGGNYTVGISQAEQDKIIASNIKNGVTILGVTGTYAPSTGGYSCLITSSDQSVPNQYVCVSGNSFTDYYSQTNKHFVASTLSCKASYGPAGTNHVYFNGTEQTLDANSECTVQLVTDVNITITGTPGSGATITITNV